MTPKSLVSCAIAILCTSAGARAQEQGASVAGNVSAINMDSHTTVAYTGAFDYRFSNVVGLELELTYAPSLEPRFAGSIIPPLPASSSIIGLTIPPPTFTNGAGRAVIFSNNVRVAVPTTTARLEPFFVAGGGVASVRQTADLRYTFPTIGGAFVGGPLVLGTQTLTQRVTSSTVGLALTLGGGVGIKATEHLWIDADLRLIRVMGDRDQDQNVGRFGAAARYRF
jgi:opacity protein-like surface antigen